MFRGISIGDNLSVNNALTGKCPNDLTFESEWGNSPITKIYIHSIKKFGFNTVKLPVTWTCHVSYTDAQCIIQDWFVNRLREIIKWCIEEQLYVIVNTQHDEDWIAHNTTTEETNKKILMLWSSILDSFDDISQKHLIFEDFNEVGYEEWEGGFERFHAISRQIYDLIRKRNKERIFISEGMWADPKTIYETYQKESYDKNLYLGFHLYAPHDFTINDEPAYHSDVKKHIIWNLQYIFPMLEELQRKHGSKLFCTEFGCNTKNRNKEEIFFWYKKVLGFMNSHKIPYVAWDDGHDRSLFDRKKNCLRIKLPALKQHMLPNIFAGKSKEG